MNGLMCKMNGTRALLRMCIVVCLPLLCAVVGCTTAQPKETAVEKDYVFFPPPPDAERVQFLCTLNDSSDVEPTSSRGFFAKFILGEERDEEKFTKFLLGPFGICAADGKLLVSDSRSKQIAVMDFQNKKYSTFGKKGRGRLGKPINVRVSDAGLYYVTDMTRQQVVVFDADGTYLKAYGKKGDFTPVDVAILGDELYVLDMREHCIKVYDLESQELKRTLGKRGTQAGEFNYPFAMVPDGEGNLLVTDGMNMRVQRIDKDGKPLQQIGSAGRTAGHFMRPKGVAVDRDGIVYVVDAMMHVVHMFNKKGQPLMHVAGGESEEGRLALPLQVTLDYDNVEFFRKFVSPGFEVKYLIYVTNQVGDAKVSVFAFGKRTDEEPPQPE